jgi:hypothetical protein
VVEGNPHLSKGENTVNSNTWGISGVAIPNVGSFVNTVNSDTLVTSGRQTPPGAGAQTL